MPEQMVVAVPSMGEGGVGAERSGHFGHCDAFTVLELENESVKNVRVVANPPHVEGGCLGPVNLLASEGVTAIVVGGMGARPLAGFEGAGITVYFENQTPFVGDVVAKLIAGQCEVMDGRHTCQH
jgi:predicted Fe-Mo cluster-binding NifX family protein